VVLLVVGLSVHGVDELAGGRDALVQVLFGWFGCGGVRHGDQLFDGFEEDNNDGDVIGRALVFGQCHKFLTDQVKVIWN